MISTSFMMGTGFMKCIPMTFSGRFVEAAMVVMEMEEVLDARMVSGLQRLSSSVKISCLRRESRARLPPRGRNLRTGFGPYPW